MNGLPTWAQQVVVKALNKIPTLQFGKVRISFEFNFHERTLQNLEVSGPSEEVKHHA